MKKLSMTVSKIFVVSMLSAGMFVTGSAAADTAGLTSGYSGTIFLAAADYKGPHLSKPHVVYERQVKADKLAKTEDRVSVPMADFRGKPPYKRHTKKQHLEKVQFARLEEGSAVTSHQHDIYRGSHGMHPPYKRNW